MRIVFIALNQGNIIALFCQWIEAKFTLVEPPLDNEALSDNDPDSSVVISAGRLNINIYVDGAPLIYQIHRR